MATSQWIRSGDIQIRKSVFAPAYSTTEGRGANCQFYRGGTTTPKVVYFDSGASESAGSLVEVDERAQWPQIFVETGEPYDYVVKDFNGEILEQAVNVPNPDPADSGSIPIGNVETGDVIWSLRTGTRTSYVRCNGRTIGSAASAATERANDDTSDLFNFIWNNTTDGTNPVIGGKGASATADFLANKPITLPDMRAGGPIGEDGMGTTATGTFADTPFATGNANTVGSLAGYNSANVAISKVALHGHTSGSLVADNESAHTHGVGTFVIANESAHTHSGTTGTESAQHTHETTAFNTTDQLASSGANRDVVSPPTPGSITSSVNSASHTHDITTGGGTAHTHGLSGNSAAGSPHGHTISGITENNGGTDAYSVVQRSTLGTWYQRL